MTTVSYSDPSKLPIQIGDGDTVQVSGLRLFGPKYPSYAADLNQNLLRLLENSSSSSVETFESSITGQLIFSQNTLTMSQYVDSSIRTLGVPFVQNTTPPLGAKRLWFNPGTQYTSVFNGTWTSVAEQYVPLTGGSMTGPLVQEADLQLEGAVDIGTYSEYDTFLHLGQTGTVVNQDISSDTLVINLNTVSIDSTAPDGIVFESEADSNGIGAVTLAHTQSSLSFSNSSISIDGVWSIQNKANSGLLGSTDPTSAVRRDYFDSTIPPLLNNVFLRDSGANSMTGMLTLPNLLVEANVPSVTVNNATTQWNIRTVGTSDTDDKLQIGRIVNAVFQPRISFSNSEISLHNSRFRNLITPAQGTDAANKKYIDDQIANVISQFDLSGEVAAAGYCKPDGTFVNVYNINAAVKQDSRNIRLFFDTPLPAGKVPDVFLAQPFDKDNITRGGTYNPKFYFAKPGAENANGFTINFTRDNVNTRARNIGGWDDLTFEWKSSIGDVPSTDNIFYLFLVFQRDN